MSTTVDNSQIITGALGTQDVKDSGLDTKDISKKITKIRESSVPLDTVTRRLPTIVANDWEVEFYQDSTRGNMLTVAEEVPARPEAFAAFPIKFTDIKNVVIGEIGMFEGVLGSNGQELKVRVIDKDPSTDTITVMTLNGSLNPDQNTTNLPVTIPNDAKMRLFSSAYGEKQASVTPLQWLPQKDGNYLQNHMLQIEETLFQQFNTTQEVDYGILDFMANRVYEHKVKTEQTSMFGDKSKLWMYNPIKKEYEWVYTSNGLIHYMGYVRTGGSKINQLDKDTILSLGADLFADNNGSESRVWFCGKDVITQLGKDANVQKQLEAKNAEVVLGLKFDTVVFPFGKVHLVHHKGLNNLGKSKSMFSLDLSNIARRVHKGFAFGWKELDLVKAGISAVDARLLQECFCLEVRNPNTHGYIEIA